MSGDKALQFVAHLRESNRLTKTSGHGDPAEQGGSERPQGKLWELTDLSASEFADEVARFSLSIRRWRRRAGGRGSDRYGGPARRGNRAQGGRRDQGGVRRRSHGCPRSASGRRRCRAEGQRLTASAARGGYRKFAGPCKRRARGSRRQ